MSCSAMHQPTIGDSEEGSKDQFHNRLECIVKQLLEKDVNIVMGDFNAKIGRGQAILATQKRWEHMDLEK